MEMTDTIEILKAERIRQITEEGWTPEHDQSVNSQGELVLAARCYIDSGRQIGVARMDMPKLWPWSRRYWKPSAQNGYHGLVRELAKGAALLMAEYDRLLHLAYGAANPPSLQSIDDVYASMRRDIDARFAAPNYYGYQIWAEMFLDDYIHHGRSGNAPDPSMLLMAAVVTAAAVAALLQNPLEYERL